MVVEYAPDYAVDIPLIWQYIAEILGAFIGAPSPNMFLLKPILELVPNDKSKQIFQFIIRFATEFSVRLSSLSSSSLLNAICFALLVSISSTKTVAIGESIVR